jgi:RNA polymerase sigma factor (sigma-70 family)
MSTKEVTVVRRLANKLLGEFSINTHPVDQVGKHVAPTSPNVSHWRVSGVPARGGAHAHAALYSNARKNCLDFDSEAEARDSYKSAIMCLGALLLFAKRKMDQPPLTRVVIHRGSHSAPKETDMAENPLSQVIQHLCRAVLLRDVALTDGQLLDSYINGREEAAFAALVQRHGPMVWGVCRRMLDDYHDAEDAFQATFLVLVRKAASIASKELLANWLYGVAHRTALKARATAAKRKSWEKQVTEMPQPAAREQELWNDLKPLLDQELSHLPEKYRLVQVFSVGIAAVILSWVIWTLRCAIWIALLEGAGK